MLMHRKTMFDRYYCIKTQNICYISRHFLHYFVLPFHRCLANEISTDYAPSTAGKYTSRNCSKSVALLIHSFSPVNAWLLITCDITFYAINMVNALNIHALYFILFLAEILLFIQLFYKIVEWQTVYTLIRLHLQEQCDLGLNCFPMPFCNKIWCTKCEDIYRNT